MRALFFPSLMAALSNCTAPASCATPVPSDGKDDVAAIQALIDAAAKRGGGVVSLGPGTFDLSHPLYLRSGVTLEGDGDDTLLTNERYNDLEAWGGTTVFAGNLTPASYTDPIIGYPGIPVVKIGPDRLYLSDCSKVPDRGTIIWISTAKGFIGTGGNFRPNSGEFSLVEDSRKCTIKLEDKIGLSNSSRILLHWSDGSKMEPRIRGAEPNRPIRNAGMRNIGIASKNGQALILDGCYRCTFKNINIRRSRRLIMVQGARHVSYDHISGHFTQRGIEVTMFAVDNVVRHVDASWKSRPGLKIAPAIRFGEYSRNNTIEDVTLHISDALAGRRDKIRFDDGAGNEVSQVRLLVDRFDGEATIFKSRSDAIFSASDVKVCLQTDRVTCNQARAVSKLAR